MRVCRTNYAQGSLHQHPVVGRRRIRDPERFYAQGVLIDLPLEPKRREVLV